MVFDRMMSAVQFGAGIAAVTDDKDRARRSGALRARGEGTTNGAR